jgi:urease accessory protein
MRHLKIAVAATALVGCSAAFAHPGHADPGQLGVAAGLLHPLTGLDHLLAMLGAGAWMAQQARGGRMLGGAFLGTMALGALAGANGLQLAGLEGGLALTVAALGILLAALARLPLLPGVAVLGAFALVHGNAHGVELPLLANAIGYLAASAMLLGIGYTFGSKGSATVIRAAGAGLAAAGVVLAAL